MQVKFQMSGAELQLLKSWWKLDPPSGTRPEVIWIIISLKINTRRHLEKEKWYTRKIFSVWERIFLEPTSIFHEVSNKKQSLKAEKCETRLCKCKLNVDDCAEKNGIFRYGRNEKLKTTLAWYVTQYSRLDVYGRLKGKRCLHLQE
jgi:hypothetical protein